MQTRSGRRASYYNTLQHSVFFGNNEQLVDNDSDGNDNHASFQHDSCYEYSSRFNHHIECDNDLQFLHGFHQPADYHDKSAAVLWRLSRKVLLE